MLPKGNQSDTAALNKFQTPPSVQAERMNERSRMKKLTTVLMVLAVAAALAPRAHAGDREWATAGKVLTGVIAGAAIVHALQPQPIYVYTAPPVVYAPAPPPVVYAPAPPPPVVVAPAPAPVVVAPAPVVCAPPPVVVYSAPVYVRPAPVVRMHLGFGHSHHHGFRHGCR